MLHLFLKKERKRTTCVCCVDVNLHDGVGYMTDNTKQVINVYLCCDRRDPRSQFVLPLPLPEKVEGSLINLFFVSIEFLFCGGGTYNTLPRKHLLGYYSR